MAVQRLFEVSSDCYGILDIFPALVVVQGMQPQHRLLIVLLFQVFERLFSPFKPIFACCIGGILDNFNILIFVVALITIQRVSAARPPAISPSVSPKGETVFSATLFPTPGVWLPVKVVEFCPPHLTHQKPVLSALVVFLLFGSYLLG